VFMLTLGGSLNLVVEASDSVLDELVSLVAQLNHRRSLDALADQSGQRRGNNRSSRLVLVKRGGGDCTLVIIVD